MRKFIIIVIVLVVAGAGVYFVIRNKDKLAQTTDLEEQFVEEPNIEQELPAIEPDAVFKEPVTYGSLNKSYSHSGFSFKYSEGFQASLNLVEGGEIVTIENDKGSGFQIFISSFDEPGPITPERIQQDQPDMEINDPKNAQLDSTKALVFNGYDNALGETFEVWVVKNGKLYQITGPRTAQQLIIETLETWIWKK